jgi:hypothetical protein
VLSSLHTGLRVLAAALGIPCALFFEGRRSGITRANSRRGNAEACLRVVIASEAKQSRVFGVTLDCFVASLLAMTGALFDKLNQKNSTSSRASEAEPSATRNP